MKKTTDMQKTPSDKMDFCNVSECMTNLDTNQSKHTSELSKNSKVEEKKSRTDELNIMPIITIILLSMTFIMLAFLNIFIING